MTFYKGYLRFAGTEIINVDRTMAYLRGGFGPAGVDFDAPVAHDGLGEALGAAAYQTPVLDEAPWYDEDREDTHGFAGVLPIDVTGLDGTTSTAEVVEYIRDGGTVQKARRSTRTVQVQALLVGDNSEAVDAGLRWLTTALHRTCDPNLLPGIGGALEGFTVLPQLFTDAEDFSLPLVPVVVEPDDAGWRGYGGTWHPDTAFFQVPDADDVIVVDGGDPDDSGPGDDVDGGGPGSPGVGFLDGGTPLPHSILPYARLVGPTALTCFSRVEVTWSLDVVTPVRVQVGAVDSLGVELYRGPVQLIETDQDVEWVWEHAAWDDWRPALWVSAPGVGVELTVSRRPFLAPEACIAPLRRTFTDLTCVAGPSEVATHVTDDCDTKMVQVEWTWVAGNPYRYGDSLDLVTELPATNAGAPEANAAGVQYEYLGIVTAASTACLAPVVAPVTCAYDPAYPGFEVPPGVPVIGDPYAIAHVNYKRSLLSIDPGVVPASGTLALSWLFTNDGTAKHGIRVRIWQQDDPDFDIHDECGFTDEFWINYLDNDAQITVDGFARTVTVVCDGQVTPATGVMRGPYRGAFEYPQLSCGERMFITVDTPATEGALVWTLTAAEQEF